MGFIFNEMEFVLWWIYDYSIRMHAVGAPCTPLAHHAVGRLIAFSRWQTTHAVGALSAFGGFSTFSFQPLADHAYGIFVSFSMKWTRCDGVACSRP
jgi:hypothetical protein